MSSIVESLGLPLFHLKVWKVWMQIQIDTFSLQGRLVLVKNVLDSNDGFGGDLLFLVLYVPIWA